MLRRHQDLNVYPGPGNDRVDGGTGRDRIYYSELSFGMSVDLTAGRADALLGDVAGVKHDRLAGIEEVFGSGFDDLIVGDEAINLLDGCSDVDVIQGMSGNDFLFGLGIDLRACEDEPVSFPTPDVLDGGDGYDFCWLPLVMVRCEWPLPPA